MNQIYRTAILAASLSVAFLSGCASEEKKQAYLAHVGDEAPPDFLVGPASTPLADFDGFSANVVETDSPSLAGATTPALAGRKVSGQVIERKGRLIFQPWTTAQVKEGRITKGGMFFIWDTSSQRGYVISEALQGYAPIFPPLQITNLVADNNALASESANGHPCHRVESIVTLSDGSSAKITEWRADDLQRFPVRVRVSGGGREETVDFTEVRMDLAAPELFVPPKDFTKYASSMSLINELMIRESSLKAGPTIQGAGVGASLNPMGMQGQGQGVGGHPVP
jgi:hypothetical protein